MRIAAAAIALALAAHAGAQSFPARSGETGILDVPDAESSGLGGGQLAAELRFDRRPGVPDDYGALPLYAVGGFSERLDIGFNVRESGQPEDPRPARILFGGAAKLRLWSAAGWMPGAALSAVLDRVNQRAVAGGRLALSTTTAAPLRLAAFVGGEAEAPGLKNGGLTAGVAASLALTRHLEVAAEALTGPRGDNYGAALRFKASPTLGVALGGNWFPREEGFRVAVTFAAAPPPRRKVPPAETPAPVPEQLAGPGAPRFTDDRPRFRLRMATSGAQALGATQSLQHGPPTPRVAAAGATPGRPVDAGGAKATAPTVDDLASAQVRDQEALADAREKRVRAAGEQLDARDAGAAEQAAQLARRERELTAREAGIELREKRSVVRTPSQTQRQLESIIAQIAAEERNLAAQETSYVPALDAASSRERAAAAKEQEEAAAAARLASSVRTDLPVAAQLELRRQALAARNRQLAAMEIRLVARGERIDATERQLRTRNDRANAWSRRLDAREERLATIEKLLEPARTPPPSAPAPRPAGAEGAAAPPQDKPAFVMVVKAPTATLQERSGAAGDAEAGRATPGVAAEKAVIAATVVMFPTPSTQLSELDRETLDNIARMAAKSGGELLVWARAKDPSLVPEAERRAAEIRGRATAAGPLEASRVTTRVTMRPGALGVDVVVSALREAAKPAPEAAPRSSGERLQPGETGKRQLRDAVQAAQPSIEACIGEHLQRRGLRRGEGALKISVSPQGRVLETGAGADFAGDEFRACLGAASAKWQFPSADGPYVVDVPITVMSGGSSR